MSRENEWVTVKRRANTLLFNWICYWFVFNFISDLLTCALNSCERSSRAYLYSPVTLNIWSGDFQVSQHPTVCTQYDHAYWGQGQRESTGTKVLLIHAWVPKFSCQNSYYGKKQSYGDMHLNPSPREAETVSSGSLTSHSNLIVEPQAIKRLCLKI